MFELEAIMDKMQAAGGRDFRGSKDGSVFFMAPALPARRSDGRLLACLDDGPDSDVILDQALAVAKGFDLSVAAARVIETARHPGTPADPIEWQVRRRKGLDHLDRLVTATERKGSTIERVLLAGPAAGELTGWAMDHGVTLMALGTRDPRGDLPGLGGTARKVMESGAASLLLVPPGREAIPPYRRILVPLDGSQRAESVVPLAARLARAHGAELVLAHVVPCLEALGDPPLKLSAHALHLRLAEQNERAVRDYLSALETQMWKEGLPVRAIVVPGGDPRRELLRLANNLRADLIIATSHGSGGMTGEPYGSVTHYLATHAPAPLLIVRPDFAHVFLEPEEYRQPRGSTNQPAARVNTADRSPEPAWSLVPAARRLGDHHRIAEGAPSAIPAWEALTATRNWLDKARIACSEAPTEAGKAAEWLLDNDYQIDRAIRQIRQDLPRPFYARLPALDDGSGSALPRVFALAHDLLRVTRLQISLSGATRFVRAYQQRQTLTIAELWAFPTMLRIACLEIIVASMTPMLRGAAKLPFAPTASACNPHGLDETGRVARGIANLGVIAAIPWNEFFDAASHVEETLSSDPSGFYARMDFETRDRCRRAVEDLARHSPSTEIEIAAKAVRLAGAERDGDVGRHVGYWLIGGGRPRLEEQVGALFPFGHRLRSLILRRPGPVYFGALALCAMGALLLPAVYLWLIGAGAFGWIVGMAVTFVPATILAVTVVHWAITRALPARVLPKLDFGKGVPKDCPTIVAVPVLVARPDEVSSLVEQIEAHWLANADPMLHIALLADLADAQEEHCEEDKAILGALKAEVTALNKRHGRKASPFHLLSRPRRFNRSEGCWMAWERKRGKLEQFNRMLVEGDDSGFSLRVGNRAALKGIRFVVTVDADTILPPGSVAALVGTLAHPLNQPRLDEATGRIVSGYSIVQPRTEISPQSGMRTLFTRLFTGDTAIDIYSRAVSDVYQDMFGAGIFVGKGIYDLHAFHRSVDGRVPENSILSHDLFEGAHGRVALATDIVLYEGFPSTYLEYARRLHRWIRGDWQLLPWLGRSVPTGTGRRESAFSGIDRWKILDNLRRSLIAPSMLALALAGWLPASGRSLVLDLAGGLRAGWAIVHRSRQWARARPSARRGAGAAGEPVGSGGEVAARHSLPAARGAAVAARNRLDPVAPGRQPTPAARMDIRRPGSLNNRR
jgi:nucleotide-binding universal stress UspA family protein